ncbi:putative ABC transport system permease protein [Catalinimonas alkaloidigena]|uniref:ABC transporter permease n=1 Tax=Catalinimonas alkaloidigena TaxID=1075417 RepID=UPI00240634CF|nr:FtsX-like permease family protein [Catalinimonas alkaloidigena]MDF9797877.1 putative ABC transport system permease protein [Catalinimonas alkaloidigena]
MLLLIAWRNIWRNKTRSFLVITSVALGLWAGTFIMAYAFGIIEQRLKDAIENEISHLQVHHPEFEKDNNPRFFIPKSHGILQEVRNDVQVKAASARVLASGMVASAISSTGGQFIGISPEAEQTVTGLQDKIIEGSYLENEENNRIVIGEKLADKLNVKVRSKIVLTFQDTSGHIVAGAFRIAGIYKTSNTTYDETHLFLKAQDLRSLLGLQHEFHEVAVLLNDPNRLEEFQGSLQQQHPELQIETWKALAPELRYMIESLDQYMIIFLIIILMALSFGIVNTMLMAVLERVREIGMLMAIGMNRTKLFGMVSLESIFLVMIAAPIGLLLAYITNQLLGQYGMDLSGLYQEGYAAYGFNPIIYPELDNIYYIRIMFMVTVAALLASIYPAITAIRLNPVVAIRKI